MLTLVVFAHALDNGFVQHDDDMYVTDNAMVQSGLRFESVRWAFAAPHVFNYAPLTLLSHMADVELFGLNPRGHHATSVLLHALAAALLVPMFHALTQRPLASMVGALFFALHPLRVESVAWISERKDVLSGVLFVCCIWAWCRRRHRLAASAFALGLLAKSSLVVVPPLVLVLDVLVLGRRDGAVRRAALLSLPAFAIGIATLAAQRDAMVTQESWSLFLRISNAFVSIARYCGKVFVPTELSPWYALPPGGWGALRTALAVAFVVVVTAAALWWWRRRRDALPLAGWLWFLLALAPVLGLVKVGGQAMADRYSYLPQMGLVLALIALIPARFARIVGAVAPPGLLLSAWLTMQQIEVWRDTASLWEQAMRVEPWSAEPPYFAAAEAMAQGDYQAARVFAERAAAAAPASPLMRLRFARTLLATDDLARADAELQYVARVLPERSDVWLLRGEVRRQQGNEDEARQLFQRALEVAQRTGAGDIATRAAACLRGEPLTDISEPKERRGE